MNYWNYFEKLILNFLVLYLNIFKIFLIMWNDELEILRTFGIKFLQHCAHDDKLIPPYENLTSFIV